MLELTSSQSGTDMAQIPARIVVGLDGSPSSLDALTWAVRQAGFTGAELEAVIAWESPILYGVYPMSDDVDWREIAQQTIDAALREALGEDRAKVCATVIEGHPAKVLLDAAVGAELLVVGNRGHGGFAQMLLGSVSAHVVTHATCPVLVVRHAHRP